MENNNRNNIEPDRRDSNDNQIGLDDASVDESISASVDNDEEVVTGDMLRLEEMVTEDDVGMNERSHEDGDTAAIAIAGGSKFEAPDVLELEEILVDVKDNNYMEVMSDEKDADAGANEVVEDVGGAGTNQVAEEKVKQLYACADCGKVYSSKFNLGVHYKSVHLGIMFHCHECGYKAAQKNTIRRHIQAVHQGHKYVCVECEKEFSWQIDLKRHSIKKHTDFKFKCQTCEVEFTESRLLRRHEKLYHSNNNEPFIFKCSVKDCNFETTETRVLYQHKKSCHKFLLKCCNFCDYKTLRAADLIRHAKRHISLPGVCEMCDVIFPSQDLLDQHLQIHAAMKKMLEKNTSGGEAKEETDELSSINLVKGEFKDYIDNDDDDDEREAMPSLEVKDGFRKRVTKKKIRCVDKAEKRFEETCEEEN